MPLTDGCGDTSERRDHVGDDPGSVPTNGTTQRRSLRDAPVVAKVFAAVIVAALSTVAVGAIGIVGLGQARDAGVSIYHDNLTPPWRWPRWTGRTATS
jgi:hypothetical protein